MISPSRLISFGNLSLFSHRLHGRRRSYRALPVLKTARTESVPAEIHYRITSGRRGRRAVLSCRQFVDDPNRVDVDIRRFSDTRQRQGLDSH